MKYKYSISLTELEHQLQKRLKIPYSWQGKKQNNSDDRKTNFIYNCPYFDIIKKQIEDISPNLYNYAWNRWYNFWSAKGIEQIFVQEKNIHSAKNEKDREKDFFISGIPFDHKTTIFPKGFHKSFEYAKENKEELIQWLYENQSQQQRKHWKNRLFIVLYDEKNGQHWKLKSELLLLQKKIHQKLQTFDVSDSYIFEKNGNKIHSEIIFIDC